MWILSFLAGSFCILRLYQGKQILIVVYADDIVIRGDDIVELVS